MGHEVCSNNGQKAREKEKERERERIQTKEHRGPNFVRACRDLFRKKSSLRSGRTSELRSFKLAPSTRLRSLLSESCNQRGRSFNVDRQMTSPIIQRSDFGRLKDYFENTGSVQTPFESVQNGTSSAPSPLPHPPIPIRSSAKVRTSV